MESDRNLEQKVATYAPADNALKSIRAVPLLFIVGISGAGKDTVAGELLSKHAKDYQLMTSYTTRKPRENHGVMERDGVDYHFIDFQTAEDMLDEGAFLEANYYAGNVYGTSIAEIAKAGSTHKTVINDIEVKGVGQYVALGMNVKPVFLLPPDFKTWWDRLMARYEGLPDQRDIHKRMKAALMELDYVLQNDFFYLVVNNQLQHTVEVIAQITHDKMAEKRPASAIEVAKKIASEIEGALATIDTAPLL